MSEEKKSPSIWEFRLPKMGESISEGTIINWLVSEGDVVEKDQIILEVATDKVDSEVPSPVRGKIINILAEADSVVKVGEVIAKIEASEDQSDQPKEVSTKKLEAESKKSKPTKKKTATTSSSKSTSDAKTYTINKNQNTYISPLIQNIAIDYHISYEELACIPATGHDGRLRKSDVFKYIEEGRPAQFAQTAPDNSGFQVPDLKLDKGKGEIIEMDRMRQMIADHMVYSKHTSPHVTAYVEADLTDMVNWRNANKKAFQKKYGEKLTFTPLFVEAVAKAVKDFPMINVQC